MFFETIMPRDRKEDKKVKRKQATLETRKSIVSGRRFSVGAWVTRVATTTFMPTKKVGPARCRRHVARTQPKLKGSEDENGFRGGAAHTVRATLRASEIVEASQASHNYFHPLRYSLGLGCAWHNERVLRSFAEILRAASAPTSLKRSQVIREGAGTIPKLHMRM